MLRTATFWMPGNHDGMTFPQVAAEALGPRSLADALTRGMEARVATLDAAMGQVTRVAYTRWTVGDGVQMVAARPHTMGGPSLSCRPYLAKTYGIDSMEASAARLVSLVEEAPDDAPMILVGHNGPFGLGDSRESPFGRDFHPDEGDWGDPDLGEAVVKAAATGRHVAVVAGHMHHHLRGGGARRTAGLLGSAKVINTARVPRIQRDGCRHHVELHVYEAGITAFAVEVRDGDSVRVAMEVGPPA
jgi:uncharacterized protein (TIGR04168 family)